MAHAHDEFDGAALGCGVEDFVDQRDERGDAFEREAFAAEIALLHDLLEDVGADEQVENALLVLFCNLETCDGFHLLVNPAAAFGGVDVVDFDADGARNRWRGLRGRTRPRGRVRGFRGGGESRGGRGRLRGIPTGGRR